MFKWYLTMTVVDGCSPIRKSHLEKESRIDTVKTMIESYGEESAVTVTVAILQKMNFMAAAQELQKAYAGAVHAEGKYQNRHFPTFAFSVHVCADSQSLKPDFFICRANIHNELHVLHRLLFGRGTSCCSSLNDGSPGRRDHRPNSCKCHHGRMEHHHLQIK